MEIEKKYSFSFFTVILLILKTYSSSLNLLFLDQGFSNLFHLLVAMFWNKVTHYIKARFQEDWGNPNWFGFRNRYSQKNFQVNKRIWSALERKRSFSEKLENIILKNKTYILFFMFCICCIRLVLQIKSMRIKYCLTIYFNPQNKRNTFLAKIILSSLNVRMPPISFIEISFSGGVLWWLLVSWQMF